MSGGASAGKAGRAEQHLKEVLAKAPPLTEEQKVLLVGILRSGANREAVR